MRRLYNHDSVAEAIRSNKSERLTIPNINPTLPVDHSREIRPVKPYQEHLRQLEPYECDRPPFGDRDSPLAG